MANASLLQTGKHMHVPLPAASVIFTVLAASIAIFIGLVGNLLVIISFWRDHLLQNNYNIYIVNLAVCDLCITSISMPVYLVYTVKNWSWPFGPIVCKVFLSEDYTACQMSVVVVVLLTWDRLVMVKHGARYNVLETHTRTFHKLAVGWTACILFNVIPIWFWEVFRGYSVVPKGECDVEYKDSLAFYVVVLTVTIMVPMFLLIVLTFKLIMAIRFGKKVIAETRKTIVDSVMKEMARASRAKAEVSTTNSNISLPSEIGGEKESEIVTDKTDTLLSATMHLKALRADGDNQDSQSSRLDTHSLQPESGSQTAVDRNLNMNVAGPSYWEEGDKCQSAQAPGQGSNDRDDVEPERSTNASSEGAEETEHRGRRRKVSWPDEGRTTSAASTLTKTVSQCNLMRQPSLTRRQEAQATLQFARIRESMKKVRVTERRHNAAKIKLLLLVIVLAICWVPYSVCTIMYVICAESCVNVSLYGAFNWLLWLKSCVNPFLYAYSSPRFKKNFGQLLGSVCPWTDCQKRTGKVDFAGE